MERFSSASAENGFPGINRIILLTDRFSFHYLPVEAYRLRSWGRSMNLLYDPWIAVQCRNGTEQRIIPAQITDAAIDAIDIVAPRPDFRGALFQMLIGLLQVAYAPKDIDDWIERWECPPTPETLKEKFAVWEAAFVLDPVSGPAFFQDLDPLMGTESAEIARLLIDSPGDKTIQDSNDHFIHGGGVEAMCPACAATALLTLQINAPGGGAGHRVSLRGGGPLTTLRIPRDTPQRATSLWQRLWANVLPQAHLNYPKPRRREDLFPWLAETRTSDPHGAGDTTPEEVHPLQAYWSTPRRIRLDWTNAVPSVCSLCGRNGDPCVRQYRTRPYGVNYSGAWVHPLTPYSYDPKQADLPISIKGQRGGIAYRDWMGLALGNAARNPAAARVVSAFNGEAGLPPDARDMRLWCFGYDMDNMKSRCWYDGTLPLPTVAPEALPLLAEAVRRVLEAAGELAFAVKRAVGAAVHPEGTGDPAVSQSFWQESEAAFYIFLEGAMRSGLEDERQLAMQYSEWLSKASRLALLLFDRWVLATPVQDGDMRRTVEARVSLQRACYGGKCKALRLWVAARQEEEAA